MFLLLFAESFSCNLRVISRLSALILVSFSHQSTSCTVSLMISLNSDFNSLSSLKYASNISSILGIGSIKSSSSFGVFTVLIIISSIFSNFSICVLEGNFLLYKYVSWCSNSGNSVALFM